MGTSIADHRRTQFAAWSGMILNIALTAGKGIIGVISGSQALLADAVHSGADVVGSLAVLVGLRIASKPPDDDHPYGHGRAELISSAIVAGLLVAAGLDVGYRSIVSLFSTPSEPMVSAALAAAISLVIKEILYVYTYRLGKRLHSRSLLANASDHQSDVYSSAAALVGIALALLGKWQHVHWLLHMDGVAGAFVGLLIIKMGYEVSIESIQVLMDRVVEGEELVEYQGVIVNVPGVLALDELRIRDHGRYLMADVQIGVQADLTVAAGHAVAVAVRRQVMQEFPRVMDVFVHVNPYSDGQRDSQGEVVSFDD